MCGNSVEYSMTYMYIPTELVEAAMYLYQATKDPFLLEIGVDMIESIEHSTRTKCGYATVSNNHPWKKGFGGKFFSLRVAPFLGHMR